MKQLHSIFYEAPKNNFTMIPNELLFNESLSVNARLIASIIISFPSNFIVNTNYLTKLTNKSRLSVLNAIKELKESGILILEKLRDKKGQFTCLQKRQILGLNFENFTMLPNELLFNENLSINAKMIGFMIMSFPKKGFFVNNAYLAKKLNLSTRTVQRAFSELKEKNVLEVRVESEEDLFKKSFVFLEYSDKKELFIDLKDIENLHSNESKKEELKEEEFKSEFNSQSPENRGDKNEIVKKPEFEKWRTYKDYISYQEKFIYNKKEKKEKKIYSFNSSLLKENKELENIRIIEFKAVKKDISLSYQKSLHIFQNIFNEVEKKAIQDFFKYRIERAKNKFLTKSTINLIINKLDNFKKQGFDIVAITQRSIENNWLGLFEIKQNFKRQFKNEFDESKYIFNKCFEKYSDFEVFDEDVSLIENYRIDGRKISFDKERMLYKFID